MHFIIHNIIDRCPITPSKMPEKLPYIYIYSRDSGEQTTGTVQSTDSATYLDLPT